MKKNFLCVIGLACMAVACNSVVDEPVQYGEISVALMGEPVVDVVCKAALDKASEDAKDFTVSIIEKESGASKYSETFYNFATQKLPLGTYYVSAQNCTEAQAEENYGMMRLYGKSSDIVLTAQNISQTAEVNCTVANAKVSVEFDSSTENCFDGLKVVLTRTSPAREITVEQTAGTTAVWFNPSDVSYVISGTFKSGTYTKEVDMSGNFTLAAKNHVRILVSVNLDNGQILAPTINFDTSLDETPSVEDNVFNPYN